MSITTTNQLRMKNNELDKKLEKHNQQVMLDIVVYLRVSSMPDAQVELVRHDLLDMTLAAQERNEDISTIIGTDYKSFCDEIILNSASKSGRDKLKEAVAIIFSGLSILLLIHVIVSGSLNQWIQNGFSTFKINLYIPIGLGFVLNAILLLSIAWGLVTWIGKRAFHHTQMADNRKSYSPKSRYLKRFLIGAGIGTFLMISLYVINKLDSIVLFTVHAFILLGVCVVLYLIGKWAS
ncbi:hypothetical protein [Paenibacillus sp. YPG26]|uniref:hypothetical protein n=1 Tax=Paenibacillus sp. YPG26 TaxID=2878915 RepID=UPI0020424514|nr:hypothetical protein [Paenibacillus sp. YPG26]USB34646.1 hypothetical protein LDO05_07800 [Paenibacillus sp. YPG26]